jgi:hypothetical protein
LSDGKRHRRKAQEHHRRDYSHFHILDLRGYILPSSGARHRCEQGKCGLRNVDAASRPFDRAGALSEINSQKLQADGWQAALPGMAAIKSRHPVALSHESGYEPA